MTEQESTRTTQENSPLDMTIEEELIDFYKVTIILIVVGGIVLGGLHSVSSPENLSDEYEMLMLFLVVFTTGSYALLYASVRVLRRTCPGVVEWIE